jgi:hypothetical protein
MTKEQLKDLLRTMGANDCLHPEWEITEDDIDWLLGIVNGNREDDE